MLPSIPNVFEPRHFETCPPEEMIEFKQEDLTKITVELWEELKVESSKIEVFKSEEFEKVEKLVWEVTSENTKVMKVSTEERVKLNETWD